MNALKTSLSLLATLGLGACSENKSPAKDVNATAAPQSTADASAAKTATTAAPALVPHKDVDCGTMLTAGDVEAICGVEVTMKSDQFFETKVEDFPCNRMFYPPANKKNFHEADEQVVSWTLQQWDTQTEARKVLEFWTAETIMENDDSNTGRTETEITGIGDVGRKGYQNGDPSSQDRELVRIESRNNCSPEDMVALAKTLSKRLAKR